MLPQLNAGLVCHRNQFEAGYLSPQLWSRVTGRSLAPDGLAHGHWAGDDFTNFAGFAPAISGTTALPSTTVPSPDGYGVYLDTATSACSIKPATTGGPGAVLLTGATDNHEVWLGASGGTGTFGQISDTAGDDKLTIFEACIEVSSVDDDDAAVFVGLAAPTLVGANGKVDDTGAMKDLGFIGFNSLHTNGGTTGTNAVLKTSYKKAGQTVQHPIATLKTMAAATKYNVGFVYDPRAPRSQRIAIYLDNEKQSTFITATNIEAATFPDAVMMHFAAGIKTGGGGATSMTVRFWQLYQAA